MHRPPVVYRNSRAAAAFFLVPHDLAQDSLMHSGLHAVGFGKFGIINATWFDYAESTIGPYHEFSIGIVASSERRRLRLAASILSGNKGSLGSFVLALPVDSEVARAGGVEHFGLPKSLAEFEMEWHDSRLSAALAQHGKPTISMDLPLVRGLPVRVRDLVVFSKRAGKLVTTVIPTLWPVKLDPIGRPTLKIHDRHHPLGQLMTKLDLEHARALLIVHGQLVSAQLSVPNHADEPAWANGAPQPLDAASTSAVSTYDDHDTAISPPTPRSFEASWSPIPIRPQVLPPREPAHPAICDEHTDAYGPESVGPNTVRSRTE
jgi:hypothetical protein